VRALTFFFSRTGEEGLELGSCRLDAEELRHADVENRAEQDARENGGQAQRERVRVGLERDKPDGLTAASHERQARAARSRAMVRVHREGEVGIVSGSGEGRTDPRRRAHRGDDEARLVRPRGVSRSVPLVFGEPEAGREESLGLRAQGTDVEAGVGSLREHHQRRFVGVCGRLASPVTVGEVDHASERSLLPRATLSTRMFCLADAHCHLDASHFEEGPDAVLQRARAAGVIGLVVVGLAAEVEAANADGLEPARFAVELARRTPGGVTACVGLHPHDASRWTSALHEGLRSLAALPEVAAVGEIGLDYHYDRSPREAQREVFARLVGLARELRKPIVVHTRSAPAETLSILEGEGARDVGGIIHCFSEDRSFAERALALGFDLSFSGIVTFKGARSVREVAAWAPLDRILVETDAPYLAPVPLRGKRCEPAHVVHTARCVAELRGVSAEDIAAATLANTERRFARAFVRPS
jgi:TatD DNase family protein